MDRVTSFETWPIGEFLYFLARSFLTLNTLSIKDAIFLSTNSLLTAFLPSLTTLKVYEVTANSMSVTSIMNDAFVEALHRCAPMGLHALEFNVSQGIL